MGIFNPTPFREAGAGGTCLHGSAPPLPSDRVVKGLVRAALPEQLVTDPGVGCWVTAAFHVHMDHAVTYDCFKGVVRIVTTNLGWLSDWQGQPFRQVGHGYKCQLWATIP